MVNDSIEAAARAVMESDALLIMAGAGMGVDSGLPDFRGDEGFWKAYPPLKHLGISFIEMANPAWFRSKPEMAWAFYGHRFFLYRDTIPHEGFSILKKWGMAKKHKAFVFTSNVDGHFQKAGFSEDSIYECHGSINNLQCLRSCTDSVWKAFDLDFDVKMEDMSVVGGLPLCPECGDIARPNVLMFGDYSWVPDRTNAQLGSFRQWLKQVGTSKLAIIECGAGTAVPTVRMASEEVLQAKNATLIRINPRDYNGPKGTVPIVCNALEGIRTIDIIIKER